MTQRNPAPSPSSPRTAPSIHVRAALPWPAIFPLVAIGLTATAPFTVGWDPVLRALVALVVVPLAVSLVVPRLKSIYDQHIWRLVDRLREGCSRSGPTTDRGPKSKGPTPMPMIDVYAAAGTFADPRALAQKLASELMAIEQVPDIPMFRQNTAAFIHDLPTSSLSNVDGDTTYVRVQVLTNAGALDRAKQLAVVSRFSTLVGEAAGDPSLAERTWVLLTEAIDGGWGLAGHANTNEELVAAARAQIAELQSKGTP